MENQVRYVDLGLVSPEVHVGIWEYQHIVEIEQPTLIRWSLEKETATFFGIYPTDLTHILEKLEDKIRTFDATILVDDNWRETSNENIAFYLEGPQITNITLFSKLEPDKTLDLLIDSVSKECDKYGIETKQSGRNDTLFKVDGKWKKAIGNGKISVFDWVETSVAISYSLHTDLANKIRDLDYKKTLKSMYVRDEEVDNLEFKGDVSDVIGGLLEKNPNINQKEFDGGVIDSFTKELNLKIKHDKISKSEHEKLWLRGHQRLTDKDWVERGINKFDI